MSSQSPYEPPAETPDFPIAASPPTLAPSETDLEHLRWLSIGHYVLSALITVFGCCGFLYVGMGVMFLTNPQAMAGPNQPPPPAFMGGFFALMGVGFMVFAWGLAVVLYLSGRWLAAHRNWMFCLIVACVSMLFQPLGTILGIFTLIVLLRPSVKVLFRGATEHQGGDGVDASGDPGRSPFAS
ncbi:MAG: hypothetical protein AB7U73_18275 [Pirellulales bacterium]